MNDRRDFLGGVLALAGASTLPATADLVRGANLAGLVGCDPRVLGVPGRRSLIADGLHPVTPERIIVIDDVELARLRSRRRGLKTRFLEEDLGWKRRWPAEPPFPPAKLDLCVGLMERMARHYGRDDLTGRWARTLWRRERLGSTGIGLGFALLHDFQPFDAKVRTDNEGVDWWLVLLPGGIDWQALDDRPVHFMVGAVMEERKPVDYLRVMEAITRSVRRLVRSEGFDPAAWSAGLAGLGTREAARRFNEEAARGLREA